LLEASSGLGERWTTSVVEEPCILVKKTCLWTKAAGD